MCRKWYDLTAYYNLIKKEKNKTLLCSLPTFSLFQRHHFFFQRTEFTACSFLAIALHIVPKTFICIFLITKKYTTSYQCFTGWSWKPNHTSYRIFVFSDFFPKLLGFWNGHSYFWTSRLLRLLRGVIFKIKPLRNPQFLTILFAYQFQKYSPRACQITQI